MHFFFTVKNFDPLFCIRFPSNFELENTIKIYYNIMYIKHFYAGYSQIYNYNEYIIVYLFKEIGITDQARIYKRFKWG